MPEHRDQQVVLHPTGREGEPCNGRDIGIAGSPRLGGVGGGYRVDRGLAQGHPVAGRRQGTWAKWYRKNIPVADDRYDEHLESLKKKGGEEHGENAG